MIAPLMLAILGPAKLGPTLPPLSSAQFQESVRAVEVSLEAHDFAKAKKLVALLPKREITLTWDEKKVPAENRAEFRDAVEKASHAWSAVKVTMKPAGGDIRVGVEPKLADDPRSGLPSNLVTFFSEVPGEPRLDARIALRRGKAGRAATANDLVNDVRYVIGTYLGLARHNLPAFTMFADSETDDVRLIGHPETRASRRDLDLADVLRKAVATQTSVGLSGIPKAVVGPGAFEGEATQGEQVDLPVEIKNVGTGVVALDAEGDCGCIVPESAPPVEPGKTGSIGMRLETLEYGKPIERNVFVYTNDPENPVRVIPVKVNVIPRYRFLAPEGSTLTVEDEGREVDFFLVFPEGKEMKATRVRTIGVEGAKATVEPWQGALPDEERNEGPKPRHGYKIHVWIPGKLPTARSLLSLNVLTDSPEFPQVYHEIYAQRGIVAFPGELFFGELGASPKSATILLSRPGKPFDITSLTSSAKYFTASAEASGKPGEYKIVVKYDGKGKSGDLQDKLTINTNDPKQPAVSVPITGSVR